MQLIPSLTNNPNLIERETRSGQHLPYSRHVNDYTVETRDGRLMQFIRMRGLLFETADTEEINYRLELRDSMLQSLGSSRFALYHHLIRRRADVDLGGVYQDNFSHRLNTKWNERLATRQLYCNDLYLTVVRRPVPGGRGLTERVRDWVGTGANRSDLLPMELRELDSAVEALLATLGSYAPERLGIYEQDNAFFSEPLELLSSLFHGETRPVRLPQQDIGNYLPYKRISFGQDAIEFGADGHSPRSFAAIISIKDYPGHTASGMFDELMRIPAQMIITQSFGFTDRQSVLGRMNLSLRRMRSAEDEALSLRAELSEAKDDVAAGRAAFGEHHCTICVRGSTLQEVDRAVAEISATLADLGIVAVREEIGLEPAFWAQFPGNFQYIARRAIISTRNFAGFSSLHNFAFGKPSGNHWGNAVSLLETTAAGPYFFNFHHGDLGNFTLIGPSGSGKTVILNFLLAQARKFSPRIVFFDKDRGAEIFIRAVEGRYDRLSPDLPSGLNPLQLDDTPVNRQFLVDWIALLAGGAIGEENESINDAIDANFEQLKNHRRLRNLVQLFRGNSRPRSGDLFSRLKPWWGEGARAWLFDNEHDLADLAISTVGFDLTALLDDAVVRTPAMFYLFHRIEEQLDGEPTIIVIDEGWKALDDPVFVKRIKDWEKTIRKRNGIIGFATQSAGDALQSQISSAIIEQAATQLFTVNPKARPEDYIEGFGLTAHEFDLIRTLPDSAHCFLVKHGTESVVARLDLSGEKELITILSGRERTVRLLDGIRAQIGDEPDDWIPRLLEVA